MIMHPIYIYDNIIYITSVLFSANDGHDLHNMSKYMTFRIQLNYIIHSHYFTFPST